MYLCLTDNYRIFMFSYFRILPDVDKEGRFYKECQELILRCQERLPFFIKEKFFDENRTRSLFFSHVQSSFSLIRRS